MSHNSQAGTVKRVTPTIQDGLDTKSPRTALDAWTREVIEWHFHPATGTPFWLERASTLGFDPRREIKTYDDLDRFGFFQDEWLRGGPVRRLVPKAYADRPIYDFETCGSTSVPTARITLDDVRIDYAAVNNERTDHSLPDGSDCSMDVPTAPL